MNITHTGGYNMITKNLEFDKNSGSSFNNLNSLIVSLPFTSQDSLSAAPLASAELEIKFIKPK